jgi:hypothetical protein
MGAGNSIHRALRARRNTSFVWRNTSFVWRNTSFV